MLGLGQVAYRVWHIAYRGAHFLLTLWLLGGLAGLVYAQDNPTPEKCEDKPYTLETPQGIAGGGNLEYDGDVAIFSDGACLQTKGILLQAPQLRYDQAKQQLQAENLEVQTKRYRFWANTALVQDKVLSAQGIRATTCKCGDSLRLLAERLSFDTDSGSISLEQSQIELYRFRLVNFAQLNIDPEKPLTDNLGLAGGQANGDVLALLPVRFDFDQGLNAGIEEFPIPGTGGFSTRFVRLTLMGLNLGSPLPGFRFGFSTQEEGRKFRFLAENQLGALNVYTSVKDGPLLFSTDTKQQQYAFGLRNSWNLEGFTLTPFGYAAKDKGQQGLSVGAELKYKVEAQDGPFRLGLEPFVVGALHERPPGYIAYGTSLEGRYEGDFAFQVSYRWGQESIPGRFWIERREATNLLSGSFAYGGLSLKGEYDFLNIQTKGSLRYGYRFDFGEVWAQYNLCAACLDTETDPTKPIRWEQRELVLGVNPNPLSCTDTFSLTPILGYDFLQQRFSRLGATLRYADCCFVWKLGYEQIIIPQGPNQKFTGRLIFGLEIR